MDESAAIEGLRRTEEKLRAYADERGLELSVDPLWPGAQKPQDQRGPVRHAVWSLAGRFPGGAVGRLRHQAIYGQTMGIKVAGQHTIFVGRLPESVGYIPMLNLRPAGIAGGLFAWAGDKRPRDKVEFESIELGRRYVIEVAKGQSENWLYQLFPPSFIDWLASNTPPDFGFRLDNGVFTCECPEWRGQETALSGEVEPEYLDLLSGSAGRVASRIRDEVLEEDGGFSGRAPHSADAHAGRAADSRHGWFIRTLLKLTGGEDRVDVAELGEPLGLKKADLARFHARFMRLPLPGTASGVLEGPLLVGSVERECHLAWMDYSSDVDIERLYLALVTDAPSNLPAAWVDDGDVGIAGFEGELPPGVAEVARQHGFGVSVAGGNICVYGRFDSASKRVEPDTIKLFLDAALDVCTQVNGRS